VLARLLAGVVVLRQVNAGLSARLGDLDGDGVAVLGRPSSKSELAVVPNMYCLIRSGFTSASHTCAAGAAIVIEALATNFGMEPPSGGRIGLLAFASNRSSEEGGASSAAGRPISTVQACDDRLGHA